MVNLYWARIIAWRGLLPVESFKENFADYAKSAI
jgi:hypothetical protein